MARAIRLSPNEESRYIPIADRALPESEQTEFIYRTLTVTESTSVQDELSFSADGKEMRGFGSRNYRACKLGLVGVSPHKPLRDDDGKPVPFTSDASGRVSDEFLARMEPMLRADLAGVIRGDVPAPALVEKPEP